MSKGMIVRQFFQLVDLFVYQSVGLLICQPVDWFIQQSVGPTICLSVGLFLHQSVSLA